MAVQVHAEQRFRTVKRWCNRNQLDMNSREYAHEIHKICSLRPGQAVKPEIAHVSFQAPCHVITPFQRQSTYVLGAVIAETAVHVEVAVLDLTGLVGHHD